MGSRVSASQRPVSAWRELSFVFDKVMDPLMIASRAEMLGGALARRGRTAAHQIETSTTRHNWKPIQASSLQTQTSFKSQGNS